MPCFVFAQTDARLLDIAARAYPSDSSKGGRGKGVGAQGGGGVTDEFSQLDLRVGQVRLCVCSFFISRCIFVFWLRSKLFLFLVVRGRVCGVVCFLCFAKNKNGFASLCLLSSKGVSACFQSKCVSACFYYL